MPRSFVRAENCVEVAFRGTYYGIPVAQVLWGKVKEEPLTSTKIITLSEALAAYYSGFVLSLLSHDFLFDGCNVRRMDVESGFEAFTPVGNHGPIFRAAGMPGNVGARFEVVTGTTGRAYRGFNTLVGLPRAIVTGNTIDSAWNEQLRIYWQAFTIQFDANEFAWVVVSRYLAGAPREEAIATPVTGVLAHDSIVDSMRKRLR